MSEIDCQRVAAVRYLEDAPGPVRARFRPNNAFLMIAAVGLGFGGYPWAAFAMAAVLVVGFGLPEQLHSLQRFKGQPKGKARPAASTPPPLGAVSRPP